MTVHNNYNLLTVECQKGVYFIHRLQLTLGCLYDVFRKLIFKVRQLSIATLFSFLNPVVDQ